MMRKPSIYPWLLSFRLFILGLKAPTINRRCGLLWRLSWLTSWISLKRISYTWSAMEIKLLMNLGKIANLINLLLRSITTRKLIMGSNINFFVINFLMRSKWLTMKINQKRVKCSHRRQKIMKMRKCKMKLTWMHHRQSSTVTQCLIIINSWTIKGSL